MIFLSLHFYEIGVWLLGNSPLVVWGPVYALGSVNPSSQRSSDKKSNSIGSSDFGKPQLYVVNNQLELDFCRVSVSSTAAGSKSQAETNITS